MLVKDHLFFLNYLKYAQIKNTYSFYQTFRQTYEKFNRVKSMCDGSTLKEKLHDLIKTINWNYNKSHEIGICFNITNFPFF